MKCDKHLHIYGTKNGVTVEEIEPFGIWIPCSERLPPLGEEVLVWAYNRCYMLTLYAYQDKEGYYWNVEDYDVVDDAFDKIIAWMPLPEPYRKDGD